MTPNFGKLVLTLPNGRTQEFALSAPSVSLGRDESNDIVLDDARVSRHHARLECSELGCTIVDIGSGNGTFLDGVRIDRATLATGNLITLGDSVLRFEGAFPPPEVSPQPEQSESPLPSSPRSSRHVSRAQIRDLLLSLETERPESSPGLAGRAGSLARGRPPHLTVRSAAATTEIDLDKGETWTIGRDARNDISLDDGRASRQHARIQRREQAYSIQDLGSSNGTWLADKRIEEHLLSDGDTLTIGSTELVFHAGSAGSEPATPESHTARRPVIVVPGTMGSALWRGSERLWPSVRNLLMRPEIFALPDTSRVEARGVVGEVVIVPKLFRLEQYDRIGDFLESSLGYERGRDLLELAYDWRVDMRVAAKQMAETIDRWAPTLPVTIIAHSQGCLVTRYYVERLGGRRKVGRLVLIGGPNYGAPNAPLNVWPSDLAHLLPRSLSSGGSMGRRLRETFATFPSMYQFLPTYPCIVDQQGQAIDLYADDSWLPPDKRPLLQSAREFHQQLPKRSSVPTACIVGYGMKTIVRMEIERDAHGVWKAIHLVEEPAGDGTVPTDSAVLLGADIHPVEQDHNSLYVDKDVMMRLRLELTR